MQEIKWPPIKSWSKTIPLNGFTHFVAINYGGEGNERWVNFVSVLDSNVRIIVSFKDLSDSFEWNQGWSEIKKNQPDSPLYIKKNNIIFNKNNISSCLHPSDDSGLDINIQNHVIREWDLNA